MKNFIIKYFNLNKWESLALLSILFVSLILIIINYSLPYLYTPKDTRVQDSIATMQLASQISVDTSQNNYQNYYTKKENKVSNGSNIKGFNFNPNTLDESGWLKLGFTDRQVKTIFNYKNKGGKFYTKADVKKMYCISDAEYIAIEPFINLPQKTNYTNNNYIQNYPPKQKLIIEINTADTALFNKQRGIGSTLAQRIVDYRLQLGGFYNTNQLKEVYGIQDTTFEKFKTNLSVNTSKITFINMNTVLYQTLNKHPYFKNGLALSILKFRKTNNNKLDSYEQLKTIPEIDIQALEKAKPYMKF